MALGRAELVAYRTTSMEVRTMDDAHEMSEAHELCAKVGGGAGSSAWWSALGAVLGAAVGALAL